MSKANKVFAAISNRSWIADISDERAQGNTIIVSLKDGWYFKEDPNCGTRGFETVRETAMGTSRNAVYNPSMVKPEKIVKAVKAPKVTKTIPPVTTKDIPAELKPTKSLSMSKDAIRKREKRAAEKAAKAVKVAE